MYLCQIINQNTYNDEKYSLPYVTIYYEVIIVYRFFHFTSINSLHQEQMHVKTNALSKFLYVAGYVDKISQ